MRLSLWAVGYFYGGQPKKSTVLKIMGVIAQGRVVFRCILWSINDPRVQAAAKKVGKTPGANIEAGHPVLRYREELPDPTIVHGDGSEAETSAGIGLHGDRQDLQLIE